jgi:hypothetical protein
MRNPRMGKPRGFSQAPPYPNPSNGMEPVFFFVWSYSAAGRPWPRRFIA